MADTWNDASKQAMKILGDKGKIPDFKTVLKFNVDVIGKALQTFYKARDDLETQMTDLEGMAEKLSGMIDQFEAKLERDDLELNEKDKEEAKTIAKAKEILSGYLDDCSKVCDSNIKGLKDAARHLILLSKYKPDSMIG